MATKTFGTVSNSILTALQFQSGGLLPADVATIEQHIKGQNAQVNQVRGAFDQTGRLHLPGGRGIISAQPGDWIAYDANGWPIIVSGHSILTGSPSPWVHS